MRFEDQLFESVCAVYPSTSVRSFSEMMGKSSGYWNSINAQSLSLSVSALVNLHDTIEVRKVLIDSASDRYEKLLAIQEMIKTELMARFQGSTGIAIAQLDDEASHHEFYG